MKNSEIAAIRHFNRFYTNVVGLLDQHILDSKYCLAEVRVLYEINRLPGLTPSEIIAVVKMDKGYLSRVLRQFEAKGLVQKSRSESDGRSICLHLTDLGKKEFDLLNIAADKEINSIIRDLSAKDCQSLVKCMSTIQQILTSVQK